MCGRVNWAVGTIGNYFWFDRWWRIRNVVGNVVIWTDAAIFIKPIIQQRHLADGQLNTCTNIDPPQQS
jgi:hypothetical protein